MKSPPPASALVVLFLLMAGSLAFTTTMRLPEVGPSKYGRDLDGRVMAARYVVMPESREVQPCPRRTARVRPSPVPLPEALVWEVLVREVFAAPERVLTQGHVLTQGRIGPAACGECEVRDS